MNNRTTPLAAAPDMLKALRAVSDDAHMRDNLYPKFTAQAGTERVGSGVVLLILLGIHDYTEGMPAIMTRVIELRVPEFIDALVADPEVRADAHAFYAEVQKRAQAG